MIKIFIFVFSLFVAVSHSQTPIVVKLVHNSNVNDEDHDGAKALKRFLKTAQMERFKLRYIPVVNYVQGPMNAFNYYKPEL